MSNISKLVAETARKCDLADKINSRILRRSQITALWEKCDDPACRLKVATQSGHSIDTARRYYEYSDKVKQGREVVRELESLRKDQGVLPQQ